VDQHRFSELCPLALNPSSALPPTVCPALLSCQRDGSRMNRYGRMAQEHWRRWLPTRYREIPDPSSFFTTLGLQVEERIVTLSVDIAGDDKDISGS
jgi:hypothetical protein